MRICTVNKSGFANYYKKSFLFYDFNSRISHCEVSLEQVDLSRFFDPRLQNVSLADLIRGECLKLWNQIPRIVKGAKFLVFEGAC